MKVNSKSVVLAVALAGLAGVAQAQSYDPGYNGPGYDRSGPRHEMMREEHRMNERHPVAFKDEYGFRYDAQGDRLDASGRVMPPPMTPPGTPALR